jgi:hypothetical protein
MALSIPLNGTLRYNGYDFDGAVELSAQMTPKYDDADRSVVYVVHRIRVRGVIAADPEDPIHLLRKTDLDFEELRKKLTCPGKELIATGLGLGQDLLVNAGTGVQDVAFGPKPRMLGWSPIAGAAACEYEWEIETALPECCDTRRYTGIAALVYAVSFSFDESGDATRTIAGHIELAMTVSPDGRIPDQIDQYWNDINVAPLAGFKRTHSRNISADGRRLDFVITDQQIPSNDAYPPLVIRISGDHTLDIDSESMATLNCAISSSITLAPGVPPIWAWLVFHTVASRRILFAKTRKESGVFIESVRIREGLWSRTHDFQVTYRILSTLSEMFNVSGLFLRLPDHDKWHEWRLSLEGSMFSRIGNAKLRHLPNDAIISLCDQAPFLNLQSESALPQSPPNVFIQTYGNEPPPKEKSYYQFKFWIEMGRQTPVSRHSPIQSAEPEDQDDGDLYADAFNWEAATSQPGGDPYAPEIIQVGGARRYSYRLKGYAIRVGYPVPRIRLREIGGQEAVEMNARYHHEKVAKVYGVDVYRAAWDITYCLASAPQASIDAPTPAGAEKPVAPSPNPPPNYQPPPVPT